MATQIRGDCPDAVVFEERDGLYWLSRDDLLRFEDATHVKYPCATVGFDKEEAAAQTLALMKRGVQVGLKSGPTVRILRALPPRRVAEPKTIPFFLAPELLLDRREIRLLECSLERRSCRIRGSYERWHAALLRHDSDKPAVFVTRLTDTMYEVDWQLTDLSAVGFQGLALASHHLGLRIACRLVTSRVDRRQSRTLADRTPEVYGQLQFVL